MSPHLSDKQRAAIKIGSNRGHRGRMKSLILQQFMYRRERSNRVINTAEAKWREYSSGQRHLSAVATGTMHYRGNKEDDNARCLHSLQLKLKQWGKAINYSWGFSYSLDVPEHTLVLLVWAIVMNIYKRCLIFKHDSEYIASSKCQVNSGVVLESQGVLSFLHDLFSNEAYVTKLDFVPNNLFRQPNGREGHGCQWVWH